MDQTPISSPSSFRGSFDLLLSALMSQTGACGACLYDGQEPGRVLALLGKIHSRHDFLAEDDIALPLHDQTGRIGVVVLSKKPDRSWTESDTGFLTSVSDAFTKVLTRLRAAEQTAELAQDVERLQAELADRKISERLEGLPAENLAIATEHIARVLETENLQSYLLQERSKLQEELRDRRVITVAKEALRKVRGLSEEQAYLLLRNESRRSRRKLRTVALEVIRDLQRPAA